MTLDPRIVILAHQYLYNVLAAPIWSDFDYDRYYDRYCDTYCLEGGGGSDNEDDYSQEVKELASKMARSPLDYSPEKVS